MLKIYKHIKAQAQIKVKMGEDRDGNPMFQNVKFTGGRVLGTDKSTVGGAFHTSNVLLQKAIESRDDFGKTFFIDHKIEAEKEVLPEEQDFRIFPGIDTINRVKNILKTEFSSKIKGEDLRGTEEMLKFCKRVGAAFPDFFTVDQGHFAEKLDKKAEEKASLKTVEDSEKKDPEKEVEVDLDLTDESESQDQDDDEDEDGDSSETEEDFEEVEVDPDELRTMTRKKLDDTAREFGIDSPEDLPNKEAVVQAILNQ